MYYYAQSILSQFQVLERLKDVSEEKLYSKLTVSVDSVFLRDDLILQFLEQKCEKTLDGSTRAKSLYDAYKIWCKSNGYFVCSAKTFYAGINQHPDWYANRRTLDGYPVYDGLRLKQ